MKKPRKTAEDEASDENSDSEVSEHGQGPAMEIADIGGGVVEADNVDDGDVMPCEVSISSGRHYQGSHFVLPVGRYRGTVVEEL